MGGPVGAEGPGVQGPGMQGPGMQGPGMQGPGMQGPGMQGPGMQGSGGGAAATTAIAPPPPPKDEGPPAERSKEIPRLGGSKVKELLGDAQEAFDDEDLSAALKLANEIIKSNPDEVEANWLAALILEQKNDVALAIGQYERAMKLGVGATRAKQAQSAIERLRALEE